MTLDYRVIHLLNVFVAFALLFTGLGSSPGMLHRLIPGSALFHSALGVASIVVIAFYGLYLLGVHRVRLFDGFQRKRLGDQFNEAKSILWNYTFGSPLPPNVKEGIGRHNVLASYASALLVVAFGLLAGSGVMLLILKPFTLLYGSMLQIHNISVELTALFFFLHLFAVLKRENRPLLYAVFSNGKVPLIWAKEHMARFLKEQK